MRKARTGDKIERMKLERRDHCHQPPSRKATQRLKNDGNVHLGALSNRLGIVGTINVWEYLGDCPVEVLSRQCFEIDKRNGHFLKLNLRAHFSGGRNLQAQCVGKVDRDINPAGVVQLPPDTVEHALKVRLALAHNVPGLQLNRPQRQRQLSYYWLKWRYIDVGSEHRRHVEEKVVARVPVPDDVYWA